MEKFYSLKCADCTLVIPTTEAALSSMTDREMVVLLVTNDRNSDFEDGDDTDTLKNGIRHIFREALEDFGIKHSLSIPSWEQ